MKPEAFVRLLAGSLVLLGSILAWQVHIAWLLLPGFVALNLIQSAFTGFCPGARFFQRLTKMPEPLCFKQLADRVRAGEAVLVDVREPAEVGSGVARGALLLPLSDLTGERRLWQPVLDSRRDRELFLYCASGMRSARAARLLAAEGVAAKDTGSLSDWITAGWPTVKP